MIWWLVAERMLYIIDNLLESLPLDRWHHTTTPSAHA